MLRPSCHDDRIEGTRVDQWLWAVRLFPTRSAATRACRAGHVSVNRAAAKASTPLRVGDRVEAHVATRERVLEVVRLVDKRVGAAVAATCLVDLSPPAPSAQARVLPREPGAGRPTKRDRRDLDRFRAR